MQFQRAAITKQAYFELNGVFELKIDRRLERGRGVGIGKGLVIWIFFFRGRTKVSWAWMKGM